LSKPTIRCLSACPELAKDVKGSKKFFLIFILASKLWQAIDGFEGLNQRVTICLLSFS